MLISDVFSVWETAVPAEFPFLSKISAVPELPGCGGVEYADRNSTGAPEVPVAPLGITKSKIAF